MHEQFKTLPTSFSQSLASLPAAFLDPVPTNVTVVTTGAVGWAGPVQYSGLSYYADRFTGFIVPPVTGNYSFYLASDDQGDVRVSPDQFASNATVMAYVQTYSPAPWIYWTTAASISAPVHLLAGQPYYIQTRHLQGQGLDFGFVGVRLYNPSGRFNSTLRDMRVSAVHERQTVSLSATFRAASHAINVTSAANSSTIGYFMLNITGAGLTSAIAANATAAAFKTTVSTKAPLNGCSSYTVARVAITAANVSAQGEHRGQIANAVSESRRLVHSS